MYGKWKVGKTSLLTRMLDPWVGKPAKEGPVAYLISADRGTKAIHLQGDKYKGRLAIAYPNELHEWRKMAGELGDKMESLVKKKPAKDLWVCIDTVSHMQQNLMTEARSIEVKATSAGKKMNAKAEDAYVRDATTRVDYNINLTHMCELTNRILRMPANILMICLEKEARDNNDRTIYVPALSGQSREKVVGDADVVARMVITDNERQLLCESGKGFSAGDRTGRLDAIEPADLAHIQTKIFSSKTTTQEEGT